MPKVVVRLLVTAAVAALVLAPGPALATAQRTFVASSGNDANPCSIAAPCRTFATAIVKTTAGGEVIVLDSDGGQAQSGRFTFSTFANAAARRTFVASYGLTANTAFQPLDGQAVPRV